MDPHGMWRCLRTKGSSQSLEFHPKEKMENAPGAALSSGRARGEVSKKSHLEFWDTGMHQELPWAKIHLSKPKSRLSHRTQNSEQFHDFPISIRWIIVNLSLEKSLGAEQTQPVDHEIMECLGLE